MGGCECGRGVSAGGCEWEGWKCRRVQVQEGLKYKRHTSMGGCEC